MEKAIASVYASFGRRRRLWRQILLKRQSRKLEIEEKESTPNLKHDISSISCEFDWIARGKLETTILTWCPRGLLVDLDVVEKRRQRMTETVSEMLAEVIFSVFMRTGLSWGSEGMSSMFEFFWWTTQTSRFGWILIVYIPHVSWNSVIFRTTTTHFRLYFLGEKKRT